jgi:hypothetical protein
VFGQKNKLQHLCCSLALNLAYLLVCKIHFCLKKPKLNYPSFLQGLLCEYSEIMCLIYQQLYHKFNAYHLELLPHLQAQAQVFKLGDLNSNGIVVEKVCISL